MKLSLAELSKSFVKKSDFCHFFAEHLSGFMKIAGFISVKSVLCTLIIFLLK